MLWSYPGLERVWGVEAHDTRVLGSALSPDGGTVGTAASDENLKVSPPPPPDRLLADLVAKWSEMQNVLAC